VASTMPVLWPTEASVGYFIGVCLGCLLTADKERNLFGEKALPSYFLCKMDRENVKSPLARQSDARAWGKGMVIILAICPLCSGCAAPA
jgi:hypothetical protein